MALSYPKHDVKNFTTPVVKSTAEKQERKDSALV